MLKIGIVGLPNVGKSTLFNALLKSSLAEAANFAFTTIDPNVGVVEVPDERLNQLAKAEKVEKVINPTIEFVDIAGLIRGAHKGEGLGNRFLANIREVDAIAMVVRIFEDENVVRVENSSVGELPKDDIETVITELALSDLEVLSRRKTTLEKEVKINKQAIKVLEAIAVVEKILENARPASEAELDEEQKKLIADLHLLTAKPFLYVFNVSEDQITQDPADIIKEFSLGGIIEKDQVLVVCALVEAELTKFDSEEDRLAYLNELGVEESGLSKLVKKTYRALDLHSFFTFNDSQARAWTFVGGETIREAVGEIHNDFTKKFIKAEVVAFDDYVRCGGWDKAKSKGLVRLEGKDYLIQDGDVVYVHHGN